jgi:DNA-binding transcriptional LysR family regulator
MDELGLVEDAQPRTVGLAARHLGAGPSAVVRRGGGQRASSPLIRVGSGGSGVKRGALARNSWNSSRIACRPAHQKRNRLLFSLREAFVMELRQLEYFVAVAEEANFTRAAERVHISQSGVSAQIRRLEQELGVNLIDRAGRTATLTAAGAAALDHARGVLSAAHAVRQAVDDVSGVIRGRLDVGMVSGCTITPLFDALAAFGRAHPGIEISLTEDNADRLTDRVRAGEIDVALIGAAGATPEGLAALTIVSERLVAAAPAGHPLLQRTGECTLAEVVGHPLVCMPPGTGVRPVLDAACASRELTPEIALVASAPDAVADLAQRGLGVAILSESMTAVGDGRLEAVAITDVEIAAILALVWRPDPSPALRALLHHARRAFGHAPAAEHEMA